MQRIYTLQDIDDELLARLEVHQCSDLSTDLINQYQLKSAVLAAIDALIEQCASDSRQRVIAETQLKSALKTLSEKKTAKWRIAQCQEDQKIHTAKIAELDANLAANKQLIEEKQNRIVAIDAHIAETSKLIHHWVTKGHEKLPLFATKEYRELMAQLATMGAKQNITDEEKLLISSATELALAYQYDKSANSKKIIICAKNILVDNSFENRHALIDAIEASPVRCNRAGLICLAAVSLFLSVALIAAGIALIATGFGMIFGGALIIAGASLLAITIPSMIATRVKAPEEAYTKFGNIAFQQAGSTAKIGFFSCVKEPAPHTPTLSLPNLSEPQAPTAQSEASPTVNLTPTHAL